MDTHTYLLLRFENRSKLVPALERLEKLTGINQLDAVDGFYSLVLEASNGVQDAVKEIRSLEGFGSMQQCEVVSFEDVTGTPDPELQKSYVFIEADKPRVREVISLLKESPQVTTLAKTRGDFDIVALIQAEDFDHIDHFVANNLAEHDAVLRLKSDRIIDLDNM